MAHAGDLVVTSGKLVSSAMPTGGLVIDEGGDAVISGEVDRDIVNNGNLMLSDRVAGNIPGTGKLVLGFQAPC